MPEAFIAGAIPSIMLGNSLASSSSPKPAPPSPPTFSPGDLQRIKSLFSECHASACPTCPLCPSVTCPSMSCPTPGNLTSKSFTDCYSAASGEVFFSINIGISTVSELYFFICLLIAIIMMNILMLVLICIIMPKSLFCTARRILTGWKKETDIEEGKEMSTFAFKKGEEE